MTWRSTHPYPARHRSRTKSPADHSPITPQDLADRFGFKLRIEEGSGGEWLAPNTLIIPPPTEAYTPLAGLDEREDRPEWFMSSREYRWDTTIAAHEASHGLFSRDAQRAHKAMDALIQAGYPRGGKFGRSAFETLVDLGGIYILEPGTITDPTIRSILATWLDPFLKNSHRTSSLKSETAPLSPAIEDHIKSHSVTPDWTRQKGANAFLFPDGDLYFLKSTWTHNQAAVAAMAAAGYPDNQIHVDTMIDMGVIRAFYFPGQIMGIELNVLPTRQQLKTLKEHFHNVDAITWDTHAAGFLVSGTAYSYPELVSQIRKQFSAEE